MLPSRWVLDGWLDWFSLGRDGGGKGGGYEAVVVVVVVAGW